LFDWAPFGSTKAAIKLHTLLDLRGPILAFIHISDGKQHDVNLLKDLSNNSVSSEVYGLHRPAEKTPAGKRTGFSPYVLSAAKSTRTGRDEFQPIHLYPEGMPA
jgi:hypothetical protein